MVRLESMLKNQANLLYQKGINASEYHLVILPIIFIKFLSKKIENGYVEYAKEESFEPNEENYPNYLAEVDYNDNYVGVDYKYLWSNIKKCSEQNVKSVLDGFFSSLEDYEPKWSDLSIYKYSSSDISPSILLKQIEYIENNYNFENINDIDLFGQIYEYFLETYNAKQGKGGEFYTPHSIVKLMVAITESRLQFDKKQITIYDPTMGSGGMLVQSLEFLRKNGVSEKNMHFLGQELIKTTWNMARMNFLLRTQSWDFANNRADTFMDDKFKDKKFDIILSNPPFNVDFKEDEYGHLRQDERFSKYGIVFGSGKANYNFFTHIIHHLKQDGIAAVVMQPAAGSASRQEEEIRKKYIDNNIVEAIIKLPQNIFVNTSIGANIWIFNKSKKHSAILFVDMEDIAVKKQKLKVITDESILNVVELFKQFTESGQITSEIPHGISSNDEIKTKYKYKLSVAEHIENKNEIKLIDKVKIAEELKKLKKDIKTNLDELDNVINYLIK